MHAKDTMESGQLILSNRQYKVDDTAEWKSTNLVYKINTQSITAPSMH